MTDRRAGMKHIVNIFYMLGFMTLLSILYGLSNYFLARYVNPVAFLPPLVFSAIALFLLKSEGITNEHAGINKRFNKTLLTIMLMIAFTTLNYIFCYTFFEGVLKVFGGMVGYYKYQSVNVITVIYFVLLNVCSELLFRAYIINTLHKHFRTSYTILIGAALSTLTLFYFFVRYIDFTMMLIILNFFVVYIFMNWLYLKYRNLTGMILGHVAMDVIMFGLITEFKFF